MENVLDQMRDQAITTLTQKIEWRKDQIAEAEREIICKLIGQPNNEYSIDSAFKGLNSLKSVLAEMELMLTRLKPQPETVKRGRPSKKK